MLSLPFFRQQEGLDDGPDFLSEEDRGVSFFFVVFTSIANPVDSAEAFRNIYCMQCLLGSIGLSFVNHVSSRSMSFKATGY